MTPTSTEYLATQAWMHLAYGRASESIAILEALCVLAPQHAWARRTLAYAYLRNGEHEKCIEQLNRCLTTRNSRTDRLLRIRALWGVGKRDEARLLLKKLRGRLSESTS